MEMLAVGLMINSRPGRYKWLELKHRESKTAIKRKFGVTAGGILPHPLGGSLHHTMGDIGDRMLAPGGYSMNMTPAFKPVIVLNGGQFFANR